MNVLLQIVEGSQEMDLHLVIIFNCHTVLSLPLSLSHFTSLIYLFSFTECVHRSHHRDICWDQSAISADVGVKEQYHLYCYNTGTTITITDTKAEAMWHLNLTWQTFLERWLSFKAGRLCTECKKSVHSSKLSSSKLHEFRRIKGGNTNTLSVLRVTRAISKYLHLH